MTATGLSSRHRREFGLESVSSLEHGGILRAPEYHAFPYCAGRPVQNSTCPSQLARSCVMLDVSLPVQSRIFQNTILRLRDVCTVRSMLEQDASMRSAKAEKLAKVPANWARVASQPGRAESLPEGVQCSGFPQLWSKTLETLVSRCLLRSPMFCSASFSRPFSKCDHHSNTC